MMTAQENNECQSIVGLDVYRNCRSSLFMSAPLPENRLQQICRLHECGAAPRAAML